MIVMLAILERNKLKELFLFKIGLSRSISKHSLILRTKLLFPFAKNGKLLKRREIIAI